ncbi:MAG: hypothetical protein ABL918_00390 [Chakrabartia sp.]
MTIFSKNVTRTCSPKFEQLASAFVAIWAVASAGSAQADVVLGGEASVRTQLSNNPYLLTGTNTDAGSVTVTLAPSLTAQDGTNRFKLSGRVQHTEFTRRYKATDGYSIASNLSRPLSPKLSFGANLGFDSSVIGANELLTFADNGSVGGGVGIPLPDDVTLNGLRQRRQTFNGDIGFEYKASARDQWQFGSAFAMARYPSGSGAQEYDYSSARLGYARKLNGNTSIGLTTSIARSDYRQTNFGDATTISPQVTLTTKLGARWSLTGSAGVSFTSTRDLVGKSTQTGMSGAVNICHISDRDRFCAFASRAVQPTSLGGVRPQTSAGMSYNVRLTERSDISANASYSRSSNSIIGNAQSVDYGRTNITYSNRLSQKIKGFVSIGYADSFRDTVNRRSNAEVSAGISYALGKR